ncbi:hypothetical protein BC826DRAFT_1106930 [Russula brevipes]|nr:hypothetical protein BC826DRAFT_1106930 [Russula brevipes]
MAQPLFDEHPLQDYLRQSGDDFEPMPGAMSDLSGPFSEECVDFPDADLKLWSWLPTPAVRLAEFLNVVVTSVQNHQSTLQEFSEHFKYDVISSSLLSSSLSPPSTSRPRSSPSPDDVPSNDHDLNPTTPLPPPPPSHPLIHRSPAWSLVLVCLCPISLFLDSFMLYVLVGTALYYFESYTLASGNLPDFIPPTFGTLKDLIAAAHLWDSTVHETINLLEIEESISPSSPPSSPLRAALHSALQSTQTQFDNVRHVLVGLTSPSSLAQLTEMYAPPSPMKLTPLHSRSGSATAASRTSVNPTPKSDKRATWNGSIPFSYVALADAGSPSRQSLKRWEKRRSDVSALLLRPSGIVMSAPTTPGLVRSLEGVEEEKAIQSDLSGLSEQEADADAVVQPEERGQFASAALELRRERRSRGIEVFLPSSRSPPPKYTPINSQPSFSSHITRIGSKSPHSTPTSPRSSYSASRFTTMQIPRHPLSLHSLNLALNGALSARRYAASHLLALRFGSGGSLDDGERVTESYWEDVRAVIALLTSALANATAPLIGALDSAEGERLRTENPTPSASHSRSSSESPERASPLYHQEELRRRRRRAHRSSSHFASFAPLPGHLTRFAAHVDALTNALNDARESLESCVASLRDSDTTLTSHSPLQDADAPALQAYERVRRELGLALRECERGREPLLELLRPPSADEDEEDEDEDRVPALGPDAESSDSDKDAAHARSPSLSPLFSARTTPLAQEQEQQEGDEGGDGDENHDRERGGVLVVGLERLPPPGIEQVFEADPDADAGDDAHRLARPRSKLSRAERIAAVKSRRVNALLGNAGDDDGDSSPVGAGGEKQWGPGGDVVQELKDVIWKVGEQRRLREQQRQVVSEAGRQQESLRAQASDSAVPAVLTAGMVTQEPEMVDDVFVSPSSSPLI